MEENRVIMFDRVLSGGFYILTILVLTPVYMCRWLKCLLFGQVGQVSAAMKRELLRTHLSFQTLQRVQTQKWKFLILVKT